MFFERDGFFADIFAVEHFSWEGAFRSVKPRPFGALVLRIDGEGRFLFSDGVELHSRAGDVLYVPHGVGYEVEHTEGEVVAFHFWEGEHFAVAENYTSVTSVGELFFEARRCFLEGSLAGRMETLSVFYRILSRLAECEGRAAKENSAFLRAYSILCEEYADPALSISELCERGGISESAFRKAFCALYGKPPIRYLTELRLQKAQSLLASGEAGIETVALSCGFRDAKYFCRVVKRYFGCTPTQLRSV